MSFRPAGSMSCACFQVAKTIKRSWGATEALRAGRPRPSAQCASPAGRRLSLKPGFYWRLSPVPSQPFDASSEAGGLGEVDAEVVAAALIAPGHLGARMAELFLDVPFVDLSG